MASSQQFSNLATPLKPREFPSSGFQVIDPSDKVEEERLPFYKPENYYPMRIGQVIQDRYQIVAKLGYGTSSTVWLSRDLRAQKYWALKVHINGLRSNQELKVYRHLADINGEDHPGQEYVRRLEDAFKLKGPDGEHDVFAWDLLEQERLFRIYDQNSEEQNDAYHLAAMTALLGPPPTEFLERSKETSKYWDEDG
ncbi:SRSF protein kinase 3 like [Verticillium longisporum]|nr:SRSF protein kinase 3 like [Verticillium longisporum]